MSISMEAQELETLMKSIAGNFPPDGNAFLERAVYDQVSRAGAECKGVSLSGAAIPSDGAPGNSVNGIMFQPATTGPDSKRVILFMHGGGFNFGSPNGHRKLAAHLANACGCMALSVDYRLSPENKYPAALDDCVAGYKHLLDSGFDKIVVAGDSCGGGLSTSMPLVLAKQGLPIPVASVSLSPWYDLTTVDGGTMDSNAEKDVLNTKPFVTKLASNYVDGSGVSKDDPLISPLFASDDELKRVSPHWISVSGNDMLADHGTRMAERLKKVGVEVVLEVHDGMQHVFEFGVGKVPESDESVRRIGEWVKKKFAS